DTSLLAVEMLTCFFCVCEGPCYAIERDYYEILGIPKDASLDDIKKAFHAVGILLSVGLLVFKFFCRKICELFEIVASTCYVRRSLNMREKHMQLTYRFSLAWTFATQLGKTPYRLVCTVPQLTGTRTGRYRAVPPKGGRRRSTEEKSRKEEEEEEEEKKKEERRKKKKKRRRKGTSSCRRPRAAAALAPARCRHSWIACELSPLVRFFSPCGEKRSRRHGRGHPVNAKPSRCPTCNGVGTVSFFLFPFTSTCSSCRGLGKIIKAILGGNVEVPTLFGKTKVKIPKGVQPGQLLILRGRGANYMMKLSGLPKQIGLVDHGDQYVRFRVHFPS
ncbi:hypothetical protein BHE74_00029722, partial [Ensete ventricosum]